MSVFDNIIGSVAKSWPWAGQKISNIAINTLINSCPHRPNPWSTAHDYVSWTSLSDRKWSSRHLPAKILASPPNVDDLTNFFRRDKPRLSSKSTCLFPAFAQYLTDGILRTRMLKTGEDISLAGKQNTSTHHLDLSTLYGRIPEQTAVLRLLSKEVGKKGRLKSQQINGEEYAPFLFDGTKIKPEFEILDLPLGIGTFKDNQNIISKIFAVGGDRVNASPQITSMNTLFLREHNRLAGIMETANPGWDDTRVFETARIITIVEFIKIVVAEYINHIAHPPIFKVDPSMAWNADWNKPNWIAVEFSLLYRWHQLIPDVMKWDKDYFVAETLMNNSLLLNVGLEKAFVNMSEQHAGQIGAFNTAVPLLGFEKKAIIQGRNCQLASYNDYRENVKLKRRKRFSDISKKSEVVEFLKNTYKSVDDIEFYVGLFAEDIDNNTPLPELLLRMVAIDAFSQALTNPLLSEHVWKEETFTKEGWKVINKTNTVRDILQRNVKGGINGDVFIGMTHRDWKRS